MSPFDVAWALLKSYTSSPATPHGKIVPSFHEQHLSNLLGHETGDADPFTIEETTSLDDYREEGAPTRYQSLYKLPPGYGPADEREVTVPPYNMKWFNDAESDWFLNEQLADEEGQSTNVPVAMQQPRPKPVGQHLMHWVENPNYRQAYGQEVMLHPSNFSTYENYKEGVPPEGSPFSAPSRVGVENIVPDDSYFTTDA